MPRNAIGGRILEVGVGTGLSLDQYARRNRIVGIDISEPMLDKARERVKRLQLDNVEAIAVMDAEHLTFAGRLLRCRGGAVCCHRRAAIRKRRLTNSFASCGRAARSS